MRRVAANVRMIDSEILWRQQRKHELLSVAARLEMFAAPGQLQESCDRSQQMVSEPSPAECERTGLEEAA